MDGNPYELLKNYTNARVALGKAGNSLNTKEILKFRLAHALARDSINSVIDFSHLADGLGKISLNTICVQSQVADLNEYLRNPDKGKVLENQSVNQLRGLKGGKADLCIIIADGLSANAVNISAVILVEKLLPLIKNLNIAPVILAKFGRVALSDQIGEIMHANISLILIGERPGLSSPASMGAYITFNPETGNTDDKRNCVSNIHSEGLSYEAAALKISWLINQMLLKQISGVNLKDYLIGGILNNL